MGDAEQAEFISITGSNPESAKFYLDMCKGDVSAAVEAFFDSADTTNTPTSSAAPPPPVASSSSNPTPASSSNPNATNGSRGNDGGGRGASSSKKKKGGRRPVGGIATLASIGGRDSEDEDESGKNYYAGGEKSGQMIQDPRKGDGNGGNGNGEEDEEDELAKKIFERARERGPLTEAEREEFNDTQRFTGAGYRLGQQEGSGPSRPHTIGRRNVTRTLTFYSNGFTVDEGELRRLDDPRNASFLQDINDGIVPHEMEEPGIGNVSINLVDKKGEEYVAPRAKVVPFSGGGQRLGAGSEAAASSAPSSGNVNAAPASVPPPSVDESRPVATVQVRLSDGTRMRVRLNDDATIGDLRQYVQASRPGVSSFTLATTFPRKILTDDKTSLKEANLNGSVVVQTPC
eukprot:Plantae.Rhodophyta-Hildenbrandia_rubra.ctg6076.p1 GENE.Plantae.Rhodophyta-Hildenbrandia_rubra.ctg6076~~Plantae.Rhodophyta-Hildenbrandia_rubra.ctg6076.p1  ORF type:complete len:439 (-),score=103.94 Plantae.Rhodophyta-Hildenbrandia_rubra.ctg6076:3249-4454(-)